MSELERRQTPTERNHELLKLALERPAPVSGQPSFKVSQEKAVGGATVFTWDVHVPECDEYPSAEAAFEAAIGYASRLSKLFPPPNGGPDLSAKLAASIEPQSLKAVPAPKDKK